MIKLLSLPKQVMMLMAIVSCFLCASQARAQLSEDSLAAFMAQPIHNFDEFREYTMWCTKIVESYPGEGKRLWPRLEKLVGQNDDRYKIEYYKVRGVGYNVLSQYDSAQSFLQKALDLAIQSGQKQSAATILLDIGSQYSNRSNYPLALKNYQESLLYTDTINQPGLYSKILNHMGHLHRLLKAYEKAENDLLKAKTLSEKHGDARYTANIVNELANVYYEQGKMDKVLEIDLGLAETNRKLENFRALAFNLNNIGEDYVALKNYPKALEYFSESLSLKKSLGNQTYLISTYLNIAGVYQKMKNYRLAEIYFDSTYHYVQNNTPDYKKSYYQHLYAFEQQRGNHKKALNHYQTYIAYKDSIFSKSNLDHINSLKASFEDEKKGRQIDAQNAQLKEQDLTLKRNRVWQLGLAVLIIAAVLVAIIFYRQKQKINRQRVLADKDRTIIAIQAEKLKALDETKSRFFANLSHDFRSPLTLLLGHLNQLGHEEAGYLTNKGELAVAKAQDNAHKLLSLTEEIRDLIALEDNKLQLIYKKVEVVPWLDLQVTMFRSAAELKSIGLTFVHDLPQDTICHLDPKQFEKVIFNLLSNAIKFTDKGGAITVQLTSSHAKEITLNVTDTGKGINEQHLPLIFDRYFQSSDNEYRSVEGLGIGLALVREIVMLHGGQVSVSSVEGKGTTTTASMPTNLEHQAEDFDISVSNYIAKRNDFLKEDLAQINHLQPLGIVQDKEHTVLIVDDYPQIRSYIANFLINSYNIYFAANGQEALKRLAHTRIDLIITDLMMPVMDGFELIDQLNEKHPDIPVMVVSARTLESERQALLEKGVNDMLSKPFSEKEMIVRVRNRIESTGKRSITIDTLVDQRKDLQNDMLQKVNTLIASRIEDSGISVADIAMAIHASERQTFRLIKDLTDQTPLDYIKDYRLMYAEELLKKKEFGSTSELAQTVGIINVSRFNKLFKAKFGYLPSEKMAK